MISRRIITALVLSLVSTTLAYSQAATDQRTYAGSFGGGIATTSGNTDTQNFNLTFDVVRDPKTKNVMKAKATYLRADQNDILHVNRTAVNLRDEWTVSGRTFVFGQLDYLRDQFKDIIFLWAPVAGVGYKFVSNDSTTFQIDGGAGGLLERNPGKPVSRSGSLTTGERFQQRLSTRAMFTQTLATIWKTSDFADSLTNASIGLTTSVVRNLELKVEFIDRYKNRPANAGIKKNDTAFVTAFVVKF